MYDVAFVLLALSRQALRVPDSSQYEDLACQIVANLVCNPNGGYVDEVTLGRQCANPHMHMLEAFLAWCAVSNFKSKFWIERTSHLAELAVTSMIQLH